MSFRVVEGDISKKVKTILGVQFKCCLNIFTLIVLIDRKNEQIIDILVL